MTVDVRCVKRVPRQAVGRLLGLAALLAVLYPGAFLGIKDPSVGLTSLFVGEAGSLGVHWFFLLVFPLAVVFLIAQALMASGRLKVASLTFDGEGAQCTVYFARMGIFPRVVRLPHGSLCEVRMETHRLVSDVFTVHAHGGQRVQMRTFGLIDADTISSLGEAAHAHGDHIVIVDERIS